MTLIRQLCNWKEPSYLAQELVKNWGEAGLVWLDSDGSNLGRWVTLAVDPIDNICCRGLPNEPQSSNPFEALRQLDPGHWTGWLSYEAGAWLEPLNPWKADEMAIMWLARHDPIFRFDLTKKELWLEGCHQKRFDMVFTWLQDLPPITDDKKNKDKSFK